MLLSRRNHCQHKDGYPSATLSSVMCRADVKFRSLTIYHVRGTAATSRTATATMKRVIAVIAPTYTPGTVVSPLDPITISEGAETDVAVHPHTTTPWFIIHRTNTLSYRVLCRNLIEALLVFQTGHRCSHNKESLTLPTSEVECDTVGSQGRCVFCWCTLLMCRNHTREGVPPDMDAGSKGNIRSSLSIRHPILLEVLEAQVSSSEAVPEVGTRWFVSLSQWLHVTGPE